MKILFTVIMIVLQVFSVGAAKVDVSSSSSFTLEIHVAHHVVTAFIFDEHDVFHHRLSPSSFADVAKSPVRIASFAAKF